MATNEILQFGNAGVVGTDILSQANYSADAQRPTGHQPGVARAQLENKVLKQASLIAAVIGQLIADGQANNVEDTLSVATIEGYLQNAIRFFASIGTTTNDNAVAGHIGEIISADVPSGSAGAMTSGTILNITSITLTAGDWDVSAYGAFIIGAITTCNSAILSISTSPVTFGSEAGMNYLAADIKAASTPILPAGPVRYSLAATTTLYLVSRITFTGGSVSTYGGIRARRVR